MVKKMLINASHTEECRVAVVCDGVLEELDVQIGSREATLGNIYKAVVNRVEPSLQAVFVDYGGVRNGFLSINDVHPSYFPESFETGRRRPRIQDVFKKDSHVIVQVAKEERHNKGASLTTNISLAGRYLVLMPGTDLCGVSRKIEDEKERKKLKEILQQLTPPENMGFIIRTAGMGRTKTELARDLDYLLKLWRSIENKVAEEAAPVLLYKEHDVVIRSIREHFSSDISEILVDEREVYKKAREFFREVMPKNEDLVRLYQERRPLFNKYQLEDQIEQVYRRRINLKSGGYILIEPTEAMVTIDVNSGSATKERGVEDTAFLVNKEAAPEIARQLRLRDLGGIIVIDFIDMTQKKHNQEVEKEIKAALKQDRAKTKVLRISSLGLLELSRQRLKTTLGTGEYLDCPLCDGKGRMRSPETTSLSVFRRIKSLLIKGSVAEVRANVPDKVGEYLLNNMRALLVDLENQYSARVTVILRPNMPEKEISVEAIKEEAHEQPPAEAPAPLAPAPIELSQEVEEAQPTDQEKKKPKKPGRRRRRSKRKPQQDVEGEAMAAEAQEGYREAEITSPAEDERMFRQDSQRPETPIDVPEEARHHLLRGAPRENATVEDTLRRQDQEVQAVSPEEAVVAAGSTPYGSGPNVEASDELAASEANASDHSREFEPDAETAGAESQGAAEPDQEPDPEASAEQTTPKKEVPVRKFLLQNFLPFS